MANHGWTNFVIPPRTKPPEQSTEADLRRGAVRRRIEDIHQAQELGELLDVELYYDELLTAGENSERRSK